MSNDPSVVRCWHCNLNQFWRSTCRRCRRPLEIPAKPVENLVALPAEESRESWKAVGYHKAMSERIGRRLKAARLAKGMSQRQLAILMKRPRTYFSKIENGRIEPKIKKLVQLSQLVGVTISELVESDREMDIRLIFVDPFLRELLDAGRGMPAILWKKTADAAERLSRE